MPLNTYIFSVSCKTFKICVLIIATTDSFSVFGWHSIYFFLCYDVFVFLCQKYVVFFSYSWIFPFKANITVDLVIFGFMSFLFCAFYFSSSLGFHLSYIFRVTQIFFFFLLGTTKLSTMLLPYNSYNQMLTSLFSSVIN